MKKVVIAGLLAVCLSGLLLAEDRRTDRSVLVIMTLNAEFLWDGVDPEEGSSQVSFPWKGSQSEAEEHMQKVAEIIICASPDIINLVEVENLAALTTFNNQFLAGRGYHPYFVQGRDTFTGQDVALLTRIDPDGEVIQRSGVQGTSGGVSKDVSKNYFATISVSGLKLGFIGLHFLAQPLSTERRLQREAQADAIRKLALSLTAQEPQLQLVILGDFNDFDGHVNPALNQDNRDHIDSAPISNVLRIIRELNPTDAADDLVNAASFVPKPLRFTAFFDRNENDQVDAPGELTSIDHILLAKGLAAKIESAQMPHDHDPRAVTDHFPVLVRLRMAVVPPPVVAVRIAGLLPNPEGNENQNEEAMIKNAGTQAVSLVGWKLRDLAGKTWALDSLDTLQPGQQKTIKRNGQPMALNNNGDTIELLSPSGLVVQTVTYQKAEEGEVITPANL